MAGIAFVSAHGSITVGNTATVILASNPMRKGCVLFNNSAQTVYLSLDSSVTTGTGLPLLPNGSFNNSGNDDLWKGIIYGIVASSTSDVRYWEFGP